LAGLSVGCTRVGACRAYR